MYSLLFGSPSSARSCSRRNSNDSEMYLRKMRPRTRCLYSADSTLPRSLLAASKSAAPLGFSPLLVMGVRASSQAAVSPASECNQGDLTARDPPPPSVTSGELADE